MLDRHALLVLEIVSQISGALMVLLRRTHLGCKDWVTIFPIFDNLERLARPQFSWLDNLHFLFSVRGSKVVCKRLSPFDFLAVAFCSYLLHLCFDLLHLFLGLRVITNLAVKIIFFLIAFMVGLSFDD